jgi:hypothetical protein
MGCKLQKDWGLNDVFPLKKYTQLRITTMLDHVHTYQRVRHQPNLYRCVSPYCKETSDKRLLQGKASRCCKCNAEIILSRDHLRLAKPLCLNCGNTKDAKLHQAKQALLSQIGIDEPKGLD